MHMPKYQHLKDLLTVDLFSVYLLSRVDIVIRYIKEFVTSRYRSIPYILL